MLHGRHAAAEESLFINLTPMIDVILTLLVFFMTATKLLDMEEQKLDVAVPRVASASPLTQLPDDIAITVDLTGQIKLNANDLSVTELRARLVAAKLNYAEQGVIIQADGRATHQVVADVMSACHAAGIARIVFKVQQQMTDR